MAASYNRHNFHKHTYCVFEQVGAEALQNLNLSYQSASGSQYYFTDLGVYRKSNHWGRAANCKWRLQSDENLTESRTKIGYARWDAFYRDNDVEKLYFIVYDAQSQKVNYAHKDSPEYQPEFVLRTAAKTRQIIKSIRQLLTTETWAKHLKYESLDVLRSQIINQLITNHLSLTEIKRQFL